MKLVPNWHKCYRWFSVQIHALQVAAVSTWAFLPQDMKAFLPPHALSIGVGVLAVLGVLGRLVDQSKPDASP